MDSKPKTVDSFTKYDIIIENFIYRCLNDSKNGFNKVYKHDCGTLKMNIGSINFYDYKEHIMNKYKANSPLLYDISHVYIKYSIYNCSKYVQ